MVNNITINGRKVGAEFPCFIIAEAGVNHNGDVKLAIKLIDAALQSGADAVKFQTFKAESLASANAPKAQYQLATTAREESQFDMLKRLELSYDEYQMLKDYCVEAGIMFMSSPFDEVSSDWLESLDVSVYKIPSGEITNIPYLDHIARKGKPMIVSTGMADLGEVESAVKTITAAGNQNVVLLHCVSNYPADPVDINLKAMKTLSLAFNVPIGFSDHTLGTEIAIAAVALGANVIEKHITLDNNLPGPDHKASLEPTEFTTLVRSIKAVESSVGNGIKEPVASERDTRLIARKSLVTVIDIKQGQVIEKSDLTTKRPGTGISPAMLTQVVGRSAARDIPSDTVIIVEMLV